MRIATWNLQRLKNAASPRGRRIMERIATINADIWILTETHESISPGGNYAAVATAHSGPSHSPGERWTMIWSRLPILGPEPTTDASRTVCARIDCRAALLDRRPLAIYGTALPWRSDKSRLPLKGGQAFVAALREQEQDWLRLRAKYPDDLLCVAGDFNQELSGSPYAGTELGRKALQRALEATKLECRTGGDVDPVARLDETPRRSNIDHICLDARLASTADHEMGLWPASSAELKGLSDHFGVWIDVPK